VTASPHLPAAVVESALGSVFGEAVRLSRRDALAGGDISLVERVETSAGSFVLKSNPDAPPGFFDAEAAGLDALRGNSGPIVIPRSIARGPAPHPFLLLEDLGEGRDSPSAQAQAGLGLAELHRLRGQAFGFDCETFCGTTRQPNTWTARWLDFYAEHRLGYQIELARNGGRLDGGDRMRLDRLVEGLDRWLDEPAEGPALIHGDLWSGNLLVTRDGRPALIDPAVSFAHREAEFGMMTLFGGFSTRLYDAYDSAWPLAPGWRDRNGLYQLYHLLNHLNLFGRSYHAQVISTARRYV
jgi:fructosamine-3-kinase